jgi:hypothetical protein
MTYQICYDNGREASAKRTEEYPTEREALGRVRELIEADEHGGISVRDSGGNILCGVRLQLKLGFPVA